MSADIQLGDLFSEVVPAVVRLPHVITPLDGELLGKVSQLTNSRPGLWPLPAPFDENDLYDEVRDYAPFANWGLPINQAEVQAIGRLVKDALFGANLLLIDSEVDQAKMAALTEVRGRRLPTGAWFTPGFQDLANLAEVVALAGWALIPVGPGRCRALVVGGPGRPSLVPQLEEWCGRQGRDTWKVIPSNGGAALEHRPAPTGARDAAIRRHIDGFLGEMELWFDGIHEDLPARVQQRVDDMGKLRENIKRARHQA